MKKRKLRVAVIGAGAFGGWSALYLQRAGVSRSPGIDQGDLCSRPLQVERRPASESTSTNHRDAKFALLHGSGPVQGIVVVDEPASGKSARSSTFTWEVALDFPRPAERIIAPMIDDPVLDSVSLRFLESSWQFSISIVC